MCNWAPAELTDADPALDYRRATMRTYGRETSSVLELSEECDSVFLREGFQLLSIRSALL